MLAFTPATPFRSRVYVVLQLTEFGRGFSPCPAQPRCKVRGQVISVRDEPDGIIVPSPKGHATFRGDRKESCPDNFYLRTLSPREILAALGELFLTYDASPITFATQFREVAWVVS